MTKPIFIANWKMNLTLKERENLALAVKKELAAEAGGKDIVICPPFVSLASIGEILKGSGIKLGAQDVFWEETGAYTGEISPVILKEINCQYAIVGHSERRQYLGETDEMVNKKTAACLDSGLTPIICVGETLEERRDNRTGAVVHLQVSRALEGIDLVDAEQIIIAYEPVWVIGSGRPISPEDAGEALAVIRQALIDLYPLTIINNNIRLVYGGSIGSDSAREFSELDLMRGFLVGGASLDAKEFCRIVKSNFS